MIQIDMQMPTNCLECPVCNEYLCCAIPVGGHGWGENNVSDFSKSRPEWCPMKNQEAVKPTWSRGKPFCGACGLRIHDGKFCSECGRPILWEGR
jgi:hypothetical protein